jgi:GntR family transcriptional regulator, transcriptional repressor for pyruvate dehydrogenase complex
MEKSILTGEFGVGEKLPSENDLCKQHGLSRASVREVLEALKSRHLVESRRGSGTFVTSGNGQNALRQSVSTLSALRSSARDFRELMDLRLLLECECVEALATVKAKAARSALYTRLQAMKKCANDLTALSDADIAFHREIVRHSGHHLYSAILEGLYDGVALRFARATYTDTLLAKKTLSEHQAIYEALDSQDAHLARTLLHNHLCESRTHLEQLLAQLDGD